MDPATFALEALTTDRLVDADPRPSRRKRYRLIARARQDGCAVVAVVSFSATGLWLTHWCFMLEPGGWESVGGSGRDMDWEEVAALPAGENATVLTRSSGGYGFPAWRHVRVPVDVPGSSTSGQRPEPDNGHLIVFH